MKSRWRFRMRAWRRKQKVGRLFQLKWIKIN